MALALITVGLMVLGLGLVQAWTIWLLKREVQRLEFRLGEALDDEDLIEFQDRLQALLAQSKGMVTELVDTAEERRQALEQSLEKVKEAEKLLALKALERAALDSGRAAARAAEAPAVAKAKAPKTPLKKAPEPKAVPPAAPRPETARAEAPRPDRDAERLKALDVDKERARVEEREAEARELAEARRTYLVRHQAGPAPSRYQKIYDLADQGLNREQIAKQADLLPGEVDLILNLRRKGPAS